MGILNFFRKENTVSSDRTSENGVFGPTYFDGLTEPILNPKNIEGHEWRRKLRSKKSEDKFRIRFYGNLHPKYHLIMQTDFAPILAYAEAVESKESILIFDGCKHGYNAMFCDKFTDEQINNRPCTNYFTDKEGNEIFEVIINTQNGIEYDDDFSEEVDDNGQIELIDGSILDFEQAKRNGFDWIMVNLINERGKQIECISEETA